MIISNKNKSPANKKTPLALRVFSLTKGYSQKRQSSKGKQYKKNEKNIPTGVELNEKSTQFFSFDQLESQTPPFTKANNNILSNQFEVLLKSHRSSIEKEVISIFKGIKSKESNNCTAQVDISVENKAENFKDLIKNAKISRMSTPVYDINHLVNVSRVKISKKIQNLPCNKNFDSCKKQISVNLMSPSELKRFNDLKAHKDIGLLSTYKGKKIDTTAMKETNKDISRYFKSKRRLTPVISSNIKIDLLNTRENKASSVIPTPMHNEF